MGQADGHVEPKKRQAMRLAAALIAVLLVAGGAYLGGRAVGHASVPGLQRHVATLKREALARDAELRARAKSAGDTMAQLQEMKVRLDVEHRNSNACRTSVDDADKTFTSLMELLSVVFDTTDPAILDPYMNQLFDDIEQYRFIRAGCTNTMSHI